MKRFLKASLVISMLLVLAAGGSALALDATDHISLAPNGEGDVLIFPAYFTGSGWDTKLTVINTSNTLSVVAKVVIRSKERSQELRDFMIFLSPNDVWTGSLYTNSGAPWVRSTDDSCLSGPSTFATEAVPFDYALGAACTGDTNELGYVEVIEGAAWALPKTAGKVAKSAILAAYNAWIGPPVDTTGVLNPKNVLAGVQEVSNSAAGLFYSLNATVLKNNDWDITLPLDVGAETLLGYKSNNNLLEIEAALAKNNLVIPFYAGAKGSVFSIFTFPTKLAGFPCGQSNYLGPYFLQHTPSPPYSVTAYDLQENTVTQDPSIVSPPIPGATFRFPSEVNYLLFTEVGGAYQEGWLKLDIQAGVTTVGYAFDLLTYITYTGAPVIGSSMRFNSLGEATWQYVAHSQGAVTVDGAADLQYQYYGQTDF
jgi:hypothetical protein